MTTCQLLIMSLIFRRYPNKLLKSQRKAAWHFSYQPMTMAETTGKPITRNLMVFKLVPLEKNRIRWTFFLQRGLLFIMSNAEQVAGKLTKPGRNANGQLHAAQFRDAVLKMTCQCMHSDVETDKTRHISPLHTTQNRDAMLNKTCQFMHIDVEPDKLETVISSST